MPLNGETQISLLHSIPSPLTLPKKSSPSPPAFFTNHSTMATRGNENVVCDCGYRAILATSWSRDNPGRRYWRCQKGLRCESEIERFLGWKDPPIEGRYKEVINSLNAVKESLVKRLIPDMHRGSLMLRSTIETQRRTIVQKERKVKVMQFFIAVLLVVISVLIYHLVY